MEEHVRTASGIDHLNGVMVVVVGPSGAGKDTLLSFAAENLCQRPDVHFVRRVITRHADAGGESHEGVSDREFDTRLENGGFSVSWQAHGLKYGIPSNVVDRLARGHLVVANGSRSALPHFRSVFPKLKVINITARPDVLATRLEQRGRESRDDILRRLQRSSLTVKGDFDVIEIDNSDDIQRAGAMMIATLEQSLEMAKSISPGNGRVLD